MDDRLFRYILPLERQFVTPQMVAAGTALACHELIVGGVTTVADMDEGLARVAEFVDRFRGHSRITPSIAPHAPYSTGMAVMERIARFAADNPDAPVQMYLAETTAEMDWAARIRGMRPVAVVRAAGLLRPCLICAHCLQVDAGDIALMAEAGVTVAHNARSNGRAGRGIAPVTALRAAGIPVGLATDGVMSGNRLDLFAQFAPVSMFQKLAAGSRGPMPAVEMIRIATLEGARVLGLDAVTGSLEPGKQADLIRISLDAPRLHPLYDIYAKRVFAAMAPDVRDVMVAGAWLLRDRTVRTLERARVMADADQIAARFRGEMARIDAVQRRGAVCPPLGPCGPIHPPWVFWTR